MEIIEVTSKEYSEVIKAPYHAFGNSAFNHLNRGKVDNVYYLLFRDGKYRLGLIGGVSENKFISPFSAPFGGFFYISEDIRIQYLEEAIKVLKKWVIKREISSIFITLPPPVYSESFISKQLNCLWREDFEITEVNLNYSFELGKFDKHYQEFIWYNARKNLRISQNAGLNFKAVTNNHEKALAYEIIRKNRESRGYPLRMSWQQVFDTQKLINADFFLIHSNSVTPVASAIVFHISETVVQVIYWGDVQGYSEMKTMNFLSYKVFEHYKASGKNIVDIGPSTENSVPNYGLCEFKESIGCRIDPKFSLSFIRK